CWHVGHASGRMRGKATYASLRRWAHMLGFGGHFLTKARRYSVTFTALRQARITYRRHQETGPDYTPLDRQDSLHAETTIVLPRLSYAGTRLAHLRRRAPRQYRRRPGPQTTRSRARGNSQRIRRDHLQRGCVKSAAISDD